MERLNTDNMKCLEFEKCFLEKPIETMSLRNAQPGIQESRQMALDHIMLVVMVAQVPRSPLESGCLGFAFTPPPDT